MASTTGFWIASVRGQRNEGKGSMASLFSALFAGVCLSVSGSLAAAPLPEPPAEWHEHVAAIRAAEAVEGFEDRCKAYPDLPDNQWRAGSAQARCTLLRKPLQRELLLQNLLDCKRELRRVRLERAAAKAQAGTGGDTPPTDAALADAVGDVPR